ncbi:MAG: response regulator transcription factor [Eubacteriales bacterium]
MLKLNKKILIVEDEKNIAELERDYLEANGYDVDISFDSISALNHVSNNSYSLILLDIMLPGVDGFEVCRQVRKKSDIPILFVSAKKEDIDKIRGLWLGADDYIVKPFSPSELVARVHAHIARYDRLTAKGEAKEHDLISIGNLNIDINARRVFVNKVEVALTNKEFDLLLFLSSNPNIVFSKDDLFNKIWGLDAIGETSTVTVHINRIREKIEDDSSNPQYIETVWGVGYRFKV